VRRVARNTVARLHAKWFGLVLVIATMPACDGIEVDKPSITHHPSATDEVVRWKLPKLLREVSGLARDEHDIVYAVADEQAVVFALDPRTGEMRSVFSLGQPALRGDFEGIALLQGWLYLISSDGILLRTQAIGGNLADLDGAAVAYERFQLPTQCEIEGLAHDPLKPRLWIACKETNTQENLRLYAWDVANKALVTEATVELPLQDLLGLTEQKRFKPSAITFQQAESHWQLLVISGAQRAWSTWRWSKQPSLLAAGRLPKSHKQAEGVVFSSSGDLLVADEGGSKAARLRIYPREHSPLTMAREAQH